MWVLRLRDGAVLLLLALAATSCGGSTQAPLPAATSGAGPSATVAGGLPSGAIPGDLALGVNRSVIVRTASGQRREIAQTLSSGPVYAAHPA